MCVVRECEHVPKKPAQVLLLLLLQSLLELKVRTLDMPVIRLGSLPYNEMPLRLVSPILFLLITGQFLL